MLEQRYRESQPATQKRDKDELLEWITKGEEAEPDWLRDVRIRSLDRVNPTSAIGKLITCMISSQNPIDPLNKRPVGGDGESIASAQSHHIFPRAFCEKYIPGWSGSDSSNLALNVMPLTKETNRRWNQMNPSDQVADVRNHWPAELLRRYDSFFINDRCLEIMEKPDKTKEDFSSFISERGKLVQQYIADNWHFILDTEPIDDEEEED